MKKFKNLFIEESYIFDWQFRLWFAWTLAIIGVLALGFAMVTGIQAGVNHDTHVTCLQFHEATGNETKVQGSFWTETCYVKSDNHWVDVNKYIGVD